MATESVARPAGRKANGQRVIYPAGLRDRYGWSNSTRWRKERDGVLPPRDVFMAGEPVGWRPETLDAWERGA